jgi:predicted transposase/invertase (TIGR01784 family)
MKKSIVHNPHDKLFRSSLQFPEVAQEYLEMFLPEDFKKRLDFNSVIYCQTTFIDEALKLSQSDVLFKAKFDDKDAYLYLLNEHESEVDQLIAFWLMKYMILIWDYHIKEVGESKALPLPMIIPMVFYTGDRKYTAHRELWELFGDQSMRMKQVLQSPFHLIEADKIPESELLAHRFAGTLSFILRNYFRKHLPQELNKVIYNLNELEQCGMRRFLVELIKYFFSVDENHKNAEELMAIVHDKMSPALEKDMASLAEELVEKGEINLIKKMLIKGVEPAFISKNTGVSINKIKEIEKIVLSKK